MLQLQTIPKVLYPADVVLLKFKNIFSFTFLVITRKLIPILNIIIKEGTILLSFIRRVTIKSRLVHYPSSGRQITLLFWLPPDNSSLLRQITLLAAARQIILNYISFVLPTGFLTFHFISFLYIFFFSILFPFFRFFSHYFVFVSFAFVRFFFFSFLFVTFVTVFFSFFSFRFFNFRFFHFLVYRCPFLKFPQKIAH